MPVYGYTKGGLRRWDYTGQDPHAPMWRVTLVVDDEVVSTSYSYHTFRKTLFLASTIVRGVPCAECCIRRCKDNHLAGWLKTNWRGELEEAEMSVQREHNVNVVTHLNPNSNIFVPTVA